ncbi:MAG: ABC transporter permease [Eubacterium sp.]|nr:ABC transporter permease [Eubacterium sp.]
MNKNGRLTKILFIAMYVVVVVVFGVLNKNYVTPLNLVTILRNVSVTAIAALGVTYVTTVGHSDMSFFLTANFAPMIMAYLASKGYPPAVSIGMAFVGAFGFGLLTAVAVAVFKLPDIIITIAIGTIAFGCGYLFSDGQKIYNIESTGFLNNGHILGLPTPVFFMILLYVISFIFLEKTKYGTFFHSVGSNPVASRFSGINVTAVVIVAYVLCVVLACFGGMINTSAKGMGDVKQALTTLTPCFTAVFVGRAIFKRPNVIGTFLGALLLQMMSNGIILIGKPYYVGDLITSILLIVALLISVLNDHEDKGVKEKPAVKESKGEEADAA